MVRGVLRRPAISKTGRQGRRRSTITRIYLLYLRSFSGVCEGPINYFAATLLNQSFFFGLGWTGLQQSPYGATPQTPWGYLQANFPGQALGYNGLAYVAAANFNLGSTPSLPQFSFIIQGINAIWGGNVVNGLDSDPALIIQDFLTNAQYGVMFPAASIDATTLLSGSRSATVHDFDCLPRRRHVDGAWSLYRQCNRLRDDRRASNRVDGGDRLLCRCREREHIRGRANARRGADQLIGLAIGVQTATFSDSSYQNYCRASISRSAHPLPIKRRRIPSSPAGCSSPTPPPSGPAES